MKASTVCFFSCLGLNLFAQSLQASFAVAGQMTTPRTGHTATLLTNGKVLIAGGYATLSGWPVWSSAELFDPSAGGFVLTGQMSSPRFQHTSTLLPDGRVLIAGGSVQVNSSNYQGLASSEVYDPSTGTFTPTGPMTTPRIGHSATLLNTGKVLIAGGYGPDGPLATAELFDPATGTFTVAGVSSSPLYGLAVLLTDGRVLIEGGDGCDVASNPVLYDPAAGAFTRTGPSANPGLFPMTATLLPDGKVYTTLNVPCDVGNAAEIFDPVAATFTAATKLPTDMVGNTATLLPGGQIFIHGAQIGYGIYQAGGSSLLYDPTSSTFAFATGAFPESDESHTSTLLSDGTVLLAGGWICCGFSVANAEIYLPVHPLKSPALYALADGTQGAILHGATQQPVSTANPAVAGEIVEIFAAGLVDGSVIPPQVWIGGRGAAVTFFGDAPGFAGVNQINFLVPSGLNSGAAPLRLDYLSRPSNTVTIAIQ